MKEKGLLPGDIYEVMQKNLTNAEKNFLNARAELDSARAEISRLVKVELEQIGKIADLLEERENMQAEIIATEEARLQAVKDTAKEIIKWIKLNGLLAYGGYVIYDSTIEQMCKKFCVEVEE